MPANQQKGCFIFNVHSTQLTASMPFILHAQFPAGRKAKKNTALRHCTHTHTRVKPHMMPFLRLASRNMTSLSTLTIAKLMKQLNPHAVARGTQTILFRWAGDQGREQGWLRSWTNILNLRKRPWWWSWYPSRGLFHSSQNLSWFSFRSDTNTANFPNGWPAHRRWSSH